MLHDVRGLMLLVVGEATGQEDDNGQNNTDVKLQKMRKRQLTKTLTLEGSEESITK